MMEMTDRATMEKDEENLLRPMVGPYAVAMRAAKKLRFSISKASAVSTSRTIPHDDGHTTSEPCEEWR